MNPVLQAVLQSAADATGARHGWLVSNEGDRLVVVNAVGPAAPDLVGRSVESHTGPVGFVLGSGQPMAMTPREGDPPLQDEIAGLIGEPTSALLCIPCGSDDGLTGALQLVNKVGGGPFSFDDAEVVTLLAGIAGTALDQQQEGPAVRTPAQLGADLQRLADADPAGYVRMARLIAGLLDRA